MSYGGQLLVISVETCRNCFLPYLFEFPRLCCGQKCNVPVLVISKFMWKSFYRAIVELDTADQYRCAVSFNFLNCWKLPV